MSNHPWLDRNLPSLARPIGWWLDGLARAPRPEDGQPPRRTVRLRFGAEGLLPMRGGQRAALRRARRHGAALVVAQDDWLSLPVQVPPVRRPEQLRILGLDLAERTPFDVGDSLFDLEDHPTAPQRAHLVPREAVADALNAAQDAGITVHALVQADAAGEFAGPVIDLSRGDRPRLGLARAALGGAVIVAGLAASVPLNTLLEERRAAAAAEGLRATWQADAAKAAQIEARLAELSRTTGAPLPAFMLPDRPPAHVLLEELTAAIPDHSYLTDLTLEDTDVRLSGISGAPEALVRALGAAPAFEDARLMGALSSQPEGSRFDIGLRVRAQAP